MTFLKTIFNRLNKRLYYSALIIIMLIAGISLVMIFTGTKVARQVTSFEECVQAGYPILESFLYQCRTPNSGRFVEEILIEEDTNDYYSNSTFGSCKKNDDCFIFGCNAKICQSKEQELLSSICVVPENPTPRQLGLECKCQEQKCQCSK